jgi:hypothetical protein
MQPPSLAEFARYGVNVLGATDVIDQPLYDHVQYPAAGTQSLQFMTTPKGQGVTTHPNAVGAKTLADTNLTLAGQLAAPQAHLSVGLQFFIYPGVNPGEGPPITGAQIARFLNDVWAIARSGVIQFTIGEKDQIVDAPMLKFPAPSYLDAAAALADATTAAADLRSQINAGRIAGPVRRITPAAIPNGQNFAVTVTYPALVPLPSGQPARIGCDIVGWLARKAQ